MFEKHNDTRDKYVDGLGVAKGVSSFAAVPVIPYNRLYQVRHDPLRTTSAEANEWLSPQVHTVGQACT